MERQQEQQQPRTMNDLPFEIISEIVKCAPGSAAKLGLTCKTFNNILEKELKENQEVFKHNKSIYRNLDVIGQRRIDILTKYMTMIPGRISDWEFTAIMKNLDDGEEKLLKEIKCINCKRMRKDMRKGVIYHIFYTENICNDCAHLCFNVNPVRINKIGPEKKKGKKKGKGKKKHTNNTNNNNN